MCVCVCVCTRLTSLKNLLREKKKFVQGRPGNSEPNTVLCAHNTHGEAEDEADGGNIDDMIMTEMMATMMMMM